MSETLITLVQSLSEARVLCAGDVILDHFHYGSVERISPEAPIPVVRLEHEDAMLGGAGNVVRNLAALGAEARFVTVVGSDRAGGDVARLLCEAKISEAALVDDDRRTSVKTRYLAGNQQMLRADSETIAPLSPGIRKKLVAAALSAMKDCAVVVLSDYGKGVLDGGVAAELIAAAAKAGKTVIVDPKGTDYSIYKGAHVITPNLRELSKATRMPVKDDGQIAAAAKSIQDIGIKAVLATLGRDGMALFTEGGDCVLLAAEALDVFDVSGAGDTVVATLAAALSVSADLADAAALANTAAGIVVGKVGTATVNAGDIIGALHHHDLSSAEAKVMALEQALEHIGKWRRNGVKIGFTNGCFDLLHPGHVSLLAQAGKACDHLVVGLNSDSSVKRLNKTGTERPIQHEAARATVLASLASVHMVIVFSEDTPLKLIEAIRPDVLVKGADYKLDQVVGADAVRSYGGKVLLAQLEPGHSTTGTIAKMAK